MEWIYDDGGRSKYFKAEKVGDCVVRAIAIASQTDYKEVYDYIAKLQKQSPRDGVKPKYLKEAAAHFGGKWTPTMTIGSGCKVHLREAELPKGRIVCSCSGHYTAVVNGVVHDIYDPSRGGTRCVYGYYEFPALDKPFKAYMVKYSIDGKPYWLWKKDKEKAIELLHSAYTKQIQNGHPIADYSITEVEVKPIANILDF